MAKNTFVAEVITFNHCLFLDQGLLERVCQVLESKTFPLF